MNKAGEYNVRLLWLAGSRATDELGQDVLTRDDNGYLWCNVEETNGRDTQDYGAKQTGADVTIRVRNYPAVTTDDLLEWQDYGYVYHINSIVNGDNELILDCYRNDDLEDFELGGS